MVRRKQLAQASAAKMYRHFAVVTVAAPEATPPVPAPRPPASAPAVRTASAKVSQSAPAASNPADPKPDDARARCEQRRAAVVESFRDALMATVDELVPVLEQRHIPVDGGVAYKMAFTLFNAWRDAR